MPPFPQGIETPFRSITFLKVGFPFQGGNLSAANSAPPHRKRAGQESSGTKEAQAGYELRPKRDVLRNLSLIWRKRLDNLEG
jgi:hypothetical protein